MPTHKKEAITTAEPLLTTAGITAAVTAVLALLVAFGLDLSQEQTAAILGVVSVAAPLVVSIARRWVTPNAHVVEHKVGSQVIAGEANEIETGEVIREIEE